MELPCVKQAKPYTCAVACLRMILAHYGVQVEEAELETLCQTTAEGTTAMNLVRAAENLGFHAAVGEGDLDLLRSAVSTNLPPLVYLHTGSLPDLFDFISIHAVVVTDVGVEFVHVNDPWVGASLQIPLLQFREAWRRVFHLVVLIWPRSSSSSESDVNGD